MEHIIRQIARKFSEQLPEKSTYYHLGEMRECGFPSFILQRIHLALERELKSSINRPVTNWSNLQSEKVEEAWHDFQQVLLEEVRLPAGRAREVLEEAVSDVLQLLVQPRKKIPAILFGQDERITPDQLEERSRKIVVYRHFVFLLQQYMRKKSLDELSREKGEAVIREADKKFIAEYSPLNWAQMMEPLFKLTGGRLDTDLLRLFFEDKNMPRFARKFDLIDDRLSRAEVIEVLSSPDLLDFEGYRDEQSNLFEDQSAKDEPEFSEGKESPVEQPPVEEIEETSEEDASEVTEGQQEEKEAVTGEEALPQSDVDFVHQEDTVEEQEQEAEVDETDEEAKNEGDTPEEDDGVEEEVPPVEDQSLNASFTKSEIEQVEADDSPAEEVEEKEDAAPQNGKRNKFDASDFHQKVNADIPSSEEEKEDGDGEEKWDDERPEELEEQEDVSSVETSEEESPVWMRFMSEDEKQQYHGQEQEEEEQYIDEPVVDLTDQDDEKVQQEQIKALFRNDRQRFEEHIFGGSARAFDAAMEELASFDDWKQASKYIDKQIFSRNMVDMYSDTAVEFTDRLQDYFLER